MKVSVIVPAYNAEKYIWTCIESVERQTFKDFEVIIVNDGSGDATEKICEELCGRYENIKIITKDNGGSASARNMGLKYSTGEYIVFVDSDDWIAENYLYRLFTVMEKEKADIVQCCFTSGQDIHYNIEHKEQQYHIYNNIQLLEEFCSKPTYTRTAVLWNKMYKKELFDGLEFVEGKSIDDEYLIYKLIYRAKKIVLLDEVLYYYYMSEGSQMRSAPKISVIDNVDVIERQMLFFKEKKLDKLYNMLLYRYYSAIFDDLYILKKYFPEERKLRAEFVKKRKRWQLALCAKETPMKDKVLLIIKRYFTGIFSMIKSRNKVEKYGIN